MSDKHKAPNGKPSDGSNDERSDLKKDQPARWGNDDRHIDSDKGGYSSEKAYEEQGTQGGIKRHGLNGPFNNDEAREKNREPRVSGFGNAGEYGFVERGSPKDTKTDPAYRTGDDEKDPAFKRPASDKTKAGAKNS